MEELFDDLDLDALYMMQAHALGSRCGGHYPYVLLIFTGKSTLGVCPAEAPEYEPLVQSVPHFG
jgi:hypothetical protein